MLKVTRLSLGRKDRLSFIEGYKAEDIWKVDETGCLWRAISDKEMGQMEYIQRQQEK